MHVESAADDEMCIYCIGVPVNMYFSFFFLFFDIFVTIVVLKESLDIFLHGNI